MLTWRPSVAILAQEPFPIRTCTVFFPFTTFLVLPCPSVYNPILLFATSSHGTCDLRRQLLLRIWGLQTVLFQTLEYQDFAQVRWRRRSMNFTYSYRSSCKTRLGSKIAKCLLRQWPPRLLRLPTLNKLLGALWFASLPVALIQQDLGIC